MPFVETKAADDPVAFQAWQRLAEAMAMAEFLAPVVRRFGRPSSAAAYATLLARGWRLASDPDPARAARTDAELRALPEAEEDDSHDPGYIVMRAMSTLSYALGAGESEESWGWARGEAVGLAAELDARLSLQVTLKEHATGFVDRMHDRVLGGLTGDALREVALADPAARALAGVLDEYAGVRGWG